MNLLLYSYTLQAPAWLSPDLLYMHAQCSLLIMMNAYPQGRHEPKSSPTLLTFLTVGIQSTLLQICDKTSGPSLIVTWPITHARTVLVAHYYKFVEVVVYIILWICQSCYLCLSKLFHAFLCISLPSQNKTKKSKLVQSCTGQHDCHLTYYICTRSAYCSL